MKILFLSDDFPPHSFGGAGTSTFELAAGMKNAGHQVFVITTCRKESDAGEQDFEGLKVFSIASNYSDRWRSYMSLYNKPAIKKVNEILKEIRPDVIHVNNIHFYLSYHCLKIGRQYARAVVFTARDTMTFTYGKLQTKRYLDRLDCRTTWYDNLKQAEKRWNPLRNFFIRRYLRYTDRIFAVSGALQKALQQNGIRNVEVMHTGVDVSAWQTSRDSGGHFRSQRGLRDKKIILFGGRLSEGKGGKKAIDALAVVVEKIPNAVLLVAGNVDWYAEKMRAEAEKLGVKDKLIFAGWMEGDELKAAYATTDVVLVPSLYLDPFPRINLEAMASGKPVIGTCYGGTPEIVEDGVTGYIVNPFHVAEVAERIIELLENPQKAEEFGKAGYERVRTEFNLERKVHEYVSAYQLLLKKNSVGF